MATQTETEPAVRVLVVDDEPNIVDVISMALRFQGFTVESAGTGADALAAVAAFRPDLIVLDVMLPDMEGFEVARRPDRDVGERIRPAPAASAPAEPPRSASADARKTLREHTGSRATMTR